MSLHERDCAPCDAARQAVDALDGAGSLHDEALRIVAGVLHRFPLGGAS